MFDWDNSKILDNDSNWQKRRVSEILFINNHNNALNRKEDIFALSHI